MPRSDLGESGLKSLMRSWFLMAFSRAVSSNCLILDTVNGKVVDHLSRHVLGDLAMLALLISFV